MPNKLPTKVLIEQKIFSPHNFYRIFCSGRSAHQAKIITALLVIAISVLLRCQYIAYESWDYNVFLVTWYDYIHDHHGIFAFKHTFANYNVPYLYILTIGNYLHLGPLYTVKITGIFSDLILAFFGYKIVNFLYPRSWKAIGALSSILMLPTVFCNSALWGQSDGIYTGFLFAGVYYYLCHHYNWSAIFFGIAISCKLQAVFIIPALIIWVLLKKFSIRALLLLPAVYLSFLLPILAIGGDIVDFLTVYLYQTSGSHTLNISAANFWALFPYSHNTSLWVLSLIILGCSVIFFIAYSYRTIVCYWHYWHYCLTPPVIIVSATVSVFLVPFLAPSMHERYLFSADCFLLLCVWSVNIRYLSCAVLTQIASLCTYIPILTSPQNNFTQLKLSPEFIKIKSYILSDHISSGPPGNYYYFHPPLSYALLGCINLISLSILTILYYHLLTRKSTNKS